MQHSKPRLIPTIEPVIRHKIFHHEKPPGENDNNLTQTIILNNKHGKQEERHAQSKIYDSYYMTLYV